MSSRNDLESLKEGRPSPACTNPRVIGIWETSCLSVCSKLKPQFYQYVSRVVRLQPKPRILGGKLRGAPCSILQRMCQLIMSNHCSTAWVEIIHSSKVSRGSGNSNDNRTNNDSLQIIVHYWHTMMERSNDGTTVNTKLNWRAILTSV